ncbi:hypothetical protein GCM10011410_32720 [Hoyosella rhizosphaerae]|uniref:Mce-associated membrane protein n=1 Tax=Hoyosella rhizosphaerae TaxID=1755582 RepID=A0A916ULU3_9ACTN|nr:hypothetical protein GCM10011410_32720 [Hoyosella rhizosphaerae]
MPSESAGAENTTDPLETGDTVENPPSGSGVETDSDGAPKSIVLAAGGIGLVALIAAGVLVGVHGPGALIGKASQDNNAFIDSAGTLAVQDRAEAALAGIFSYSYQTLDEDFDTARAFLTESMREDYESTIETTRQAAEQREASVQMAVRRSGVVSLTRDAAEVLALAVVSTETGGIPDQQFSGPILVDLALVDGEWLVDAIRER